MLQPLNDLLQIECADGNLLPYLGYVVVSLEMPALNAKASSTLCFVVPDSKFNTTVPILLGTNILVHFMSECRETYGVRYLQKANLSSPWYLTFRSLSLREKQLARNGDKIALIKSAERSQVIIHPNSMPPGSENTLFLHMRSFTSN